MTAVPEWKDATGFKGAGWLKWFNRFRSVVDIFPSSLPLSGYLRFKASSTMSFSVDSDGATKADRSIYCVKAG